MRRHACMPAIPEVGPGQVGSLDHDPWDYPAIPMGRGKNCWVLKQLSPEAFGNSGDQYLFSLNLGMFSQLVHSVAQRANLCSTLSFHGLWWHSGGGRGVCLSGSGCRNIIGKVPVRWAREEGKPRQPRPSP